MRRALLLALLLAFSSPLSAAPPPALMGDVGVCDPWSPQTCAKPDASGGIPAASSGTITNPSSSFTRPSDTSGYISGDLIATSTTAGSVVVPSFSLANSAGGAIIHRLRLYTNITTGWGATLTINLWSAAPTYTNGDNGAYAVATGSSNFLGSFTCALTQFGDGAAGACTNVAGNASIVRLASGTSIYWDLQATSSLTPASAQTFTVKAELLN